ncbi:hypothetical protein VCRA2114E365_150036 [Vibrio crassostreae]|nr:hypothetical protein VCRA2115O371_130084 [Vibrio crassostreae]CAK1758625.1 hypothetical protein VCRA2113O351_140036 [Vibrio crassostreae]CAK1762958.1 hypothetical protein VCRA2117O376_140036 [Vibrio crassostreae]CAK1768567.1 hypothetical protein VCRA2114O369_140085 [Vibrio crassostreae]CAK1769352.1 hypothetical protein VCRA2113O362_140085 [Vibrio crassostreae]
MTQTNESIDVDDQNAQFSSILSSIKMFNCIALPFLSYHRQKLPVVT